MTWLVVALFMVMQVCWAFIISDALHASFIVWLFGLAALLVAQIIASEVVR